MSIWIAYAELFRCIADRIAGKITRTDGFELAIKCGDYCAQGVRHLCYTAHALLCARTAERFTFNGCDPVKQFERD